MGRDIIFRGPANTNNAPQTVKQTFCCVKRYVTFHYHSHPRSGRIVCTSLAKQFYPRCMFVSIAFFLLILNVWKAHLATIVDRKKKKTTNNLQVTAKVERLILHLQCACADSLICPLSTAISGHSFQIGS